MATLKKRYTDDEEEFLRDNFLQMTNWELAQELHRDSLSIQSKLHQMGLSRIQNRDLYSGNLGKTMAIEKLFNFWDEEQDTLLRRTRIAHTKT